MNRAIPAPFNAALTLDEMPQAMADIYGGTRAGRSGEKRMLARRPVARI